MDMTNDPVAARPLVTLSCGHVHFHAVAGPPPAVGEDCACWSACDGVGRHSRPAVFVDLPGTEGHRARLPFAGSTAPAPLRVRREVPSTCEVDVQVGPDAWRGCAEPPHATSPTGLTVCCYHLAADLAAVERDEL